MYNNNYDEFGKSYSTFKPKRGNRPPVISGMAGMMVVPEKKIPSYETRRMTEEEIKEFE